MSWRMRRPNTDHQLVNEKRQAYKNKKKWFWSSELSPDNQDDQGQDQDQGSSPSKDMISAIYCLGEDRGMGTNDEKTGRLNVRFVNCRGWWSREVDLKLVMGLKRFGMLGIAETFLQKDEEVSVAGYVWYGRNREGGRRASGGVGVLENVEGE